MNPLVEEDGKAGVVVFIKFILIAAVHTEPYRAVACNDGGIMLKRGQY